MQERIIFHIDVNSAFLSWTAAYQKEVLGLDGDLREVPSAIVGNRDARHSIVLAKSIPAKKLGIRTGEPLYLARQKCPQLQTAEPDYALYTRASRQFIALLKTYTPLVEQYSIDEAWADLTGATWRYGGAVETARHLKDQISQQLGFTVNIGVSSNKLLAKVAGDFEKPNRVHTLFPDQMAEKFWPLPVRDLFLVGGATERKLRQMGIYTIGDLARANPQDLQRYLHKPGVQLWHFANGRGEVEVKPVAEENKGYGNSVTMPADVLDYPQADRVLLSLCETVGSRIRRDGKAAACVAVRIRNHRFQNTVHQMQLPGATDNTVELYQAARTLLRQMWDRSEPLRQLGVQVTKMASECYEQCQFFPGPSRQKQRAVDRTLDQLRDKYGDQAVVRAVFLSQGLGSMAGGLAPQRRTGVTKPVPPERHDWL